MHVAGANNNFLEFRIFKLNFSLKFHFGEQEVAGSKIIPELHM